jgi:hypothetical protein
MRVGREGGVGVRVIGGGEIERGVAQGAGVEIKWAKE